MHTDWQRYTELHEAHTVVGDLRVRRVPAPELGGEREVLCLLPPDALTSGQRYPVVHMLDGQNLFDAETSYAGEWRVDETMAALHREGRDAIVVGIANGGDARYAEYTPYAAGRRAPGGAGRAAATLRFLVDTVKPQVEAAFPVRRDRTATAIAGSSLGGLMSLYAAWERPDIYGLVAAFSPAFPSGQAALLERLVSVPRPDLRIHLDVGGREGSMIRADRVVPLWSWLFRRDVRRCRDALLAAGFREGVDLRYVEEPGAVHREDAWAGRLSDALRFLLGSVPAGHGLGADLASGGRTGRA
jgi:predicted alpha/beta superfamily hydrolase